MASQSIRCETGCIVDDEQHLMKKMPDCEYECSRCKEMFFLEPIIYRFLVESDAEVESLICPVCLGQVELVSGDLEFPVYH